MVMVMRTTTTFANGDGDDDEDDDGDKGTKDYYADVAEVNRRIRVRMGKLDHNDDDK